jgi:hypothetical protein
VYAAATNQNFYASTHFMKKSGGFEGALASANDDYMPVSEV